MNGSIDFIIQGNATSDSQYSLGPLFIAKELAKTNRVFFIDKPLTYIDFIKQLNKEQLIMRIKFLFMKKNIFKKLENASKNLTIVNTWKLALPLNWLSNTSVYKMFAKYNDGIIFSTIRKIIKEYKVENFVFFNSFNPYFARQMAKDIKPLISIYQCRDDISQERYIARHGVTLEREAASYADMTLATSKELKNILEPYAKKIHYLPNAAKTEIFEKALNEDLQIPDDLKRFEGKKIIGYIGAICQRIDYDLIKHIALQHSDKVFFFIGRQTTNDWKKFGLDKIENIHFAGPREMEEAPAYLKYMDCTLIPFKCNTLTKSIYPLKVNEYLAAGKPVVSTCFSEDINDFKEVVYLSSNVEDFTINISKAIEENDQHKIEERVKTAGSNNWSSRVETLKGLVAKAI